MILQRLFSSGSRSRSSFAPRTKSTPRLLVSTCNLSSSSDARLPPTFSIGDACQLARNITQPPARQLSPVSLRKQGFCRSKWQGLRLLCMQTGKLSALYNLTCWPRPSLCEPALQRQGFKYRPGLLSAVAPLETQP